MIFVTMCIHVCLCEVANKRPSKRVRAIIRSPYLSSPLRSLSISFHLLFNDKNVPISAKSAWFKSVHFWSLTEQQLIKVNWTYMSTWIVRVRVRFNRADGHRIFDFDFVLCHIIHRMCSCLRLCVCMMYMHSFLFLNWDDNKLCCC